MNNQQAYNAWSESYDEVENKTRDLEAVALRELVSTILFKNVLELGSGTGKNTSWLLSLSQTIICADFSDDMLRKAEEKIKSVNVSFRRTDIRENWEFREGQFDLISSSLVLEHIEDLGFIFREAAKVLSAGGHFYIGELHPFRQYQGSKAGFETGNGVFELQTRRRNSLLRNKKARSDQRLGTGT